MKRQVLGLREILFIDDRLDDLPGLLAGLREGVEAIVIRAGEDPLSIIGRTLAVTPGIQALHLVAHGGPGRLDLGTGFDRASLSSQSDAFQIWGEHLDSDAEILIYGCRSGAEPAFIAELEALTGRPVIASKDIVGAGAWSLAVPTGALAFTTELQASYQGRFVTTTGTPGPGDAHWHHRR